jgi:hypothetical protein
MEKSGELREFVLSIYKAMQSSDLGFWERHLSQEAGVLVIGSDPTEWWDGYSAILKALRPQDGGVGGSASFTGSDPRAYSEGTVGWFADRFTWRLPDGREIPMRITGVCNREAGEWKMVQSHASVGIPNSEAFG